MTSLSDVDLYGDIPRYLKEIRDLGNQHPFLFYQKLGYAVTGVLPDANGAGRPDIFMSKRLAG
jgi:aminoglycoside 6'-N-acetyltransferase I